jgi:hypothetical protein
LLAGAVFHEQPFKQLAVFKNPKMLSNSIPNISVRFEESKKDFVEARSLHFVTRSCDIAKKAN